MTKIIIGSCAHPTPLVSAGPLQRPALLMEALVDRVRATSSDLSVTGLDAVPAVAGTDPHPASARTRPGRGRGEFGPRIKTTLTTRDPAPAHRA
ncbi:hypothetical protein AB0420_31270 [Streptomyces caelestis]|uniref:hypothetical protein n=1 Tax=Streptomyces caelestis TaxID=36816 RepID=UPI00344B45C4